MHGTLAPPTLVRRAGLILLISASLQIAVGGIRFVDGTMLQAFAQHGFDAQLSPFSQYLFDSPLKIMLLRASHLSSPLAIGVLFLALTLAPLVILPLARSSDQRAALAVVLAVLPLWKMMFQSVGVGDSVTVLLSLMLVICEARFVLAIAAALLTLWHLQQGVIMVGMLSLVLAVRREPGDVRRIVGIVAGALVGVALYLAIRTAWIPVHESRLTFMRERIATFLPANLRLAPLALAALLPGLLVLWRAGRWRGSLDQWIAAGLMAMSVAIGSLTTDFSRVITLLSTPLVVLIIGLPHEPRALAERLIRPSVWLPIALLSAAIPFVSWSGIDIFLWNALREDLHKYLGT